MLPRVAPPLCHRCPQVHLGEAEDGTVSYRNLSMYRANTEEEALNLVCVINREHSLENLLFSPSVLRYFNTLILNPKP